MVSEEELTQMMYAVLTMGMIKGQELSQLMAQPQKSDQKKEELIKKSIKSTKQTHIPRNKTNQSWFYFAVAMIVDLCIYDEDVERVYLFLKENNILESPEFKKIEPPIKNFVHNNPKMDFVDFIKWIVENIDEVLLKNFQKLLLSNEKLVDLVQDIFYNKMFE